MAGFSRRQAVESLPKIQKEQKSLNTTDTYFDSGQPRQQESNTSRIVNGLLSLGEGATEVMKNHKQRKIELDKVTQQQRAIRGLDPSDNATQSGRRAYQVVKMRDDTLETNAEITQQIKNNPDMTDEEYEIMTREAYSGMLDKYGDDPQLAKAAANQIQESQGQMHQIRETAKAKHQEWKKMDALNQGITAYVEAADNDPEQVLQMVKPGGQLSNEADALGITPQKYREKLVERATVDASNGDGALLKAISSQPWAEGDARIDTAKDKFEAWERQENSVAIGNELYNIEKGLSSGQMNRQQALERAQALNDRFPGAVSSAKTQSLLRKGEQARKEMSRTDKLLARYAGPDRSVSIGNDPSISRRDRGKVVQGFTDLIVDQVDKKVQSGEITAQEGREQTLQRLVQFGREEQVEVPRLKGLLKNALNPDNMDWAREDGEVPDDMKPGILALSMLNDQDAERYLSDEEKNQLDLYNDFSEAPKGEVDSKAFFRAAESIRARGNASVGDRDKVYEDLEDEMGDQFNVSSIGSFFSDLGHSLNFTDKPGATETSEANKKYLVRKSEDIFWGLARANGNNGPRMVERATSEVANGHFATNSGSLVTRNPGQLNRQMNRKFHAQGGTQTLTPEQTSTAMERYVDRNMDNFRLESSYGEELNPEDIRINVTDQGLITVFDGVGDKLNSVDLLDDVVSSQTEYLKNQAREEIEGRVEFMEQDPNDIVNPSSF